MKLLITLGIVLSLAAFSAAQQVKPSAEQVAQASGYQSVKSAVVPPMADTVKSTAAAKKEIKTTKPAAAPAVKSVPASAQGVIVIPPSVEKTAVAKPAAAAVTAKPAEVKSAAVAVKPAEVKPAAVAAKPAEVKPVVAVKSVQPAAKPVADPQGGFAVTRKHLVLEGETLWDLSDRYYKDPFKWGKIYAGNRETIDNPDLIYPREEIFIPEITEVVGPSPKTETVTDMNVPDGEEGVVAPAGEAPVVSAPVVTAAPAEVGKAASGLLNKEPLDDLAAGMSEEMPIDLKEWSDNVKIAPAGWDPDGVITALIKSDTSDLPGSLTISGEMVRIKAYKKGVLKPGNIVNAYMKGAIAVDKNGKKLGRELQKTGMLEVVSVEGSVVQARVIEATTSVSKDQLIVK